MVVELLLLVVAPLLQEVVVLLLLMQQAVLELLQHQLVVQDCFEAYTGIHHRNGLGDPYDDGANCKENVAYSSKSLNNAFFIIFLHLPCMSYK